MTIEGYAALFGLADLSGDTVRAGAFQASLARIGHRLPMIFEHQLRQVCGVWYAREDGRGLFVEGRVDEALPGGRAAIAAMARGTDGLSIGFRARRASQGPKGRTLIEIDLLEASIVALPMQPQARLRPVRATVRAV